MSFQSLIIAAPTLSTSGLISYLQGLFRPLFLRIVGIMALFFLFTREITRFVQFLMLAVAIAVIFYAEHRAGVAQGIVNGYNNAEVLVSASPTRTRPAHTVVMRAL